MRLAGTELAKPRVTATRTKLFQIATRVTVSLPPIVLYLNRHNSYQHLFYLPAPRLTTRHAPARVPTRRPAIITALLFIFCRTRNRREDRGAWALSQAKPMLRAIYRHPAAVAQGHIN